MKKTLDKIRIHREGWKIFLEMIRGYGRLDMYRIATPIKSVQFRLPSPKTGISSREKAAGLANGSWELPLKHIKTPILHIRYYFKERGQPSARS